ncbi:uncharacterized protein DUF992 [Yoonia sediminilitoris]|uniref:Uncharacterized protein DUF992 n=1 Tax=Yoonia sediminilitoris TaxID=1286148 RepID=A0A2T6K5I2_9RHOB|nr:uncharacterized protein DUF992 [Yoonia sediminilitoris]RCW89617.1 uncharacterized protein DUF992 [Yoonia sediminilitoris]
MSYQRTKTPICLVAFALIGALAGLLAQPATAQNMERFQAGTLVCKGSGGWGAIFTSKKEFDCTFAKLDSNVRGTYKGVIERFGLDIGVTGDTALVWLVFGPEGKIGDNYSPGSLAGTYGGIGAEVSLGVGLGANALLGRGESSFALQPVSVQVQTGISVAAGVETLKLEYVGPLQDS